MDDTVLTPPVGASVWALEMFTHLTEHTRREGALLQEYVEVASTTESKALSYVVDLLVEDERRHHRFFDDLAASLKSESELSSEQPVIPRLDLDRLERADLLAATQRLLDHEQSDAKELRRLHNALRDMQDTTLWGLLVEIMMRDTEKHISILRFVADHAKPKRSLLRRD